MTHDICGLVFTHVRRVITYGDFIVIVEPWKECTMQKWCVVPFSPESIESTLITAQIDN